MELKRPPFLAVGPAVVKIEQHKGVDMSSMFEVGDELLTGEEVKQLCEAELKQLTAHAVDIAADVRVSKVTAVVSACIARIADLEKKSAAREKLVAVGYLTSIAELEKKNANLSERIAEESRRACVQEWADAARIVELEKANTDLSERIIELEKSRIAAYIARIAKLEKTNADLSERIVELEKSRTAACTARIAWIARIVELEKKNADLGREILGHLTRIAELEDALATPSAEEAQETPSVEEAQQKTPSVEGTAGDPEFHRRWCEMAASITSVTTAAPRFKFDIGDRVRIAHTIVGTVWRRWEDRGEAGDTTRWYECVWFDGAPMTQRSISAPEAVLAQG